MVKFSTTILKFGQQGEKTGWTYITIIAKIAAQLKSNNKKSFRVKGKLDEYTIEKTALIPIGEGDFIMPLNATVRKAIRKQKGDMLKVQLETDVSPILPPSELLECMADEPKALEHYNSLPQSHRNYFTKWIDSAKTDGTKAKRIALVIRTMVNKMDFGTMLRIEREEKKKLMG
jgi:hypothetical protein